MTADGAAVPLLRCKVTSVQAGVQVRCLLGALHDQELEGVPATPHEFPPAPVAPPGVVSVDLPPDASELEDLAAYAGKATPAPLVEPKARFPRGVLIREDSTLVLDVGAPTELVVPPDRWSVRRLDGGDDGGDGWAMDCYEVELVAQEVSVSSTQHPHIAADGWACPWYIEQHGPRLAGEYSPAVMRGPIEKEPARHQFHLYVPVLVLTDEVEVIDRRPRSAAPEERG